MDRNAPSYNNGHGDTPEAVQRRNRAITFVTRVLLGKDVSDHSLENLWSLYNGRIRTFESFANRFSILKQQFYQENPLGSETEIGPRGPRSPRGLSAIERAANDEELLEAIARTSSQSGTKGAYEKKNRGPKVGFFYLATTSQPGMPARGNKCSDKVGGTDYDDSNRVNDYTTGNPRMENKEIRIKSGIVGKQSEKWQRVVRSLMLRALKPLGIELQGEVFYRNPNQEKLVRKAFKQAVPKAVKLYNQTVGA